MKQYLFITKKITLYNPQLLKGDTYTIKRLKPNINSVYGKTGMNNIFLSKNNGIRYPKRIIKFNVQRGKHPTQKPVALLAYLIKTYTKEGEMILDNCSGSGSTRIAAEITNRKSIMIEKDETYFDIGIKRKVNDKNISYKISHSLFEE